MYFYIQSYLGTYTKQTDEVEALQYLANVYGEEQALKLFKRLQKSTRPLGVDVNFGVLSFRRVH